MILAFTLSMPRNNAWNGRWSGDERLYVKTRTFSSQKAKAKAQSLIDHGRYYYNFGDGWCAGIDVREVSAAEARKLRAKSNGFCGYDWMIERILEYGEIIADHQLPKPAGATP